MTNEHNDGHARRSSQAPARRRYQGNFSRAGAPGGSRGSVPTVPIKRIIGDSYC